jgi:TolA-binding protein
MGRNPENDGMFRRSISMKDKKSSWRLGFSGALAAVIWLGTLNVLSPMAFPAEEKSPQISQERKDLDFADGLYQRGMYDSAAQKYADFLGKYPASTSREQALFRQGESLYQFAAKKLDKDLVKIKITHVKAKGVFQEWLRLYPQGQRRLDSLLRFGELSYKLDDAKGGLDALLQVIQESKEPALLESALFYAGRCCETLGQDDEALKRYRQIISTYPKGEFTAFSTFLLGDVLARKGEKEQAAAQFDAIWKNPANYIIPEGSNLISDAQLRSAQLLYQMDKFEDASKAYMAYVKDHPEGDAAVKAKYSAAWAEYQRKNYAGALEITRALQRESLPADLLAGILFLHGTCSYQQKLYDEAIQNFREAIADPGAGEYRERAWYQMAWSYYLSEKYDSALEECNNLLKLELAPAMSANVHFLLGQSRAQRKEYDAAIKEMQVCLQVAPASEYAEQALYLLADLLYRAEKFSEAGDAFERFFDAYPKSSRAQEALMWAVNARYAGKQLDRAVAAADRLLQTYPDMESKLDVIYRKALALYQMKKYEDALAALKDLLALPDSDPRKADALYLQAYVSDVQNDKKKASTLYGDLLKKFPSFGEHEEARLRKALCDYDLKDNGVAFEGFYAVFFGESGSLLGRCPEILFWMITTADERENHEEALEIARRILTLFKDTPQICERAVIAVGNQLVALEKWKEALENSDLFMKTYPDSLFCSENYWSRAKALEGVGQQQQALDWYEKSFTEMEKLSNPEPAFEATLFMDRGRLLEKLERPGDALESFLRVAIIYDHPQLTPEALYRSIRCHKALKAENDAKTLYDEIQSRYPDSSWAQKAKTEWEGESAKPVPETEPNNATKTDESRP